VLVVDDQPPQVSRDGASHRMVAILGLLTDLGHSVDFASARGWPPGLQAPLQRLTALGVRVTGLDTSPETLIADHACEYDVVVLSRLDTATRLLGLVRRSAPGVPVVYDAMQIAHLNSYRRAKLAGSAALLRRSLAERRQELRVIASVDAIIAVSAPDATLMREYDARVPIAVVTGVHMDPPADRPPRGRRTGGLFVGYMRNLENELAARRLIEAIWPLVLEQMPDEPLHLVGAGTPDWIAAAARRRPWLRVHGGIRELDPLLLRAAVSVLPIRGGAGIKTKALQSLAYGVPVVATADGLRGIPVIDGEHALLGESDAELAGATASVLADARLWDRLSANGPALFAQRFGRAAARAGLSATLGSLGGGNDRHRR
jgi:glycosyltransferase involved in cell wall biosynthesis